MTRVTDEELANALKAAEDENGVDRRLAEAIAAMTPDARRQSEANVRRWIAAARHSYELTRVSRDKV
jgi:hypothetical protein